MGGDYSPSKPSVKNDSRPLLDIDGPHLDGMGRVRRNPDSNTLADIDPSDGLVGDAESGLHDVGDQVLRMAPVLAERAVRGRARGVEALHHLHERTRRDLVRPLLAKGDRRETLAALLEEYPNAERRRDLDV